MFRLNRFMHELIEPTPVRRAVPPGPVVIWNLIRRCNLNCPASSRPGRFSRSWTT
jgi:hypothetical protein